MAKPETPLEEPETPAEPETPVEPEASEQERDEGEFDGDEVDDDEEGEAHPFDSGDFHAVTRKLVINAVHETLLDSKFDWELVRPFLETAREMARADFEEARFRLHTVRAEGENWVEAEEAYLGLSVADRDDGEEWLAETRWLSDIATEDDDPEQVRLIVAALGKTIAKLDAWLADKEAGDAAKAAPPA